MTVLHISWCVGDFRSGDGWQKSVEVPSNLSFIQAYNALIEAFKKDRGFQSNYFLKDFTEEDWNFLVDNGWFARKKDSDNYLKIRLEGEMNVRQMSLEERVLRIERKLGLAPR